MTPDVTTPVRSRPLLLAVRWLGLSILGSVPVAVLAAGVGSRVAMRISGATGARCAGLLTENGNRCGEFTVEGTVLLLVFGGIGFGVLGGVAFALLRPFVRGLGRWAGPATGLFLLAVGGRLVLDPHNVDFTRFGTPVVNVLVFASLFIVYGLLVVPTVGWLDRRLPAWPPPRPLRVRTVAGVAVNALAALPALALVVVVGARTLIHPVAIGLVLAVVAAVVVARWRLDGRPASAPARRRTVLWGRALLVVGAVVGAVPTSRAVLEILAS